MSARLIRTGPSMSLLLSFQNWALLSLLPLAKRTTRLTKFTLTTSSSKSQTTPKFKPKSTPPLQNSHLLVPNSNLVAASPGFFPHRCSQRYFSIYRHATNLRPVRSCKYPGSSIRSHLTEIYTQEFYPDIADGKYHHNPKPGHGPNEFRYCFTYLYRSHKICMLHELALFFYSTSETSLLVHALSHLFPGTFPS